MKIKKTIMILSVLMLFLLIAGVSANDINTTDQLSIDENIDVESSTVDHEVISEYSNDNSDDKKLEYSYEDNLSEEGEFIDVNEAYVYLNQFRNETGVWQWNSDDTTKTVFNTDESNQLKPLTRDLNLEKTAKIRAKELVEKFDHERPDGTLCFTIFPDGLMAMGENIAYGQTSAKEVTEAWKETNDHYNGQGHRRNMLSSDFNCVGIAGYKLNGVIYWVQDFGYSNNIIQNNTPTTINNHSGNKTIIKGSLSDLNRLIQNSTTTVNLDQNYTYNYECDYDLNDGIIISKPLNIDGQGYTINGLSQARIFKINANNVILNNINFIKGNAFDQGGAIYLNCTNGTVMNCNFINNTANEYGGAIYWTSSENITIIQSNFTNNQVFNFYGGAIYIYDSNSTLINDCNFEKNTAGTLGGAIDIYKNGVVVKDGIYYFHSHNITNCTFKENYAWTGGAIGCSGYYTTISDCIFIKNSARYAGALHISGDNDVLKNSIFINNHAACGGAISTFSNNLTIFNTSFINNYATEDSYGRGGSAIFWNSGHDGNITKCIFINNKGTYTVEAEDYYNEYMVADYNWWGENATNYDNRPLTNFDVNKWYYLNMTVSENMVGVTLNNLYNNVSKSIQKDNNCILPEVKFTLSSNNNQLDNINVTVCNGLGNVIYNSNTQDKIIANYYSTSISNEVIEKNTNKPIVQGDFGILQNLIDNAEENSIINLERDYNYNCDIDTITEGIVINKKLTINGNGHTINAQNKSRIFKVKVEGVVLNNINFINGKISTAGGAIYVHHFCSVDVINSTFSNNNVEEIDNTVYSYTHTGGAIYSHYGSSINILDSNFINNDADSGGAIHSYRSNVFIMNSNFKGMSCGAICSFGSNVSIMASNFIDNHEGGAIYLIISNVLIENSTFINNTAGYWGGALFIEGTNVDIINSIFINNSANETGGAICSFVDNILNIDKSIFINNSANYGGAVGSNGARNNDCIVNSVLINNKDKSFSQVYSGLKSDYNWWGNNATNYNVAPNNYVNKWYYLNMTAEDGIATVSLNNLYTQYNTIQKDNNCKLPNLNFTLTGVNTTFTYDTIIVNNSSDVMYLQYEEYGSLSASYLNSSITINVYKKINRENIHINVTHGQNNSTMVIKLPEDINRNVTVVFDGVVYNVTVYEGIGVLIINNTNFSACNQTNNDSVDEKYAQSNCTIPIEIYNNTTDTVKTIKKITPKITAKNITFKAKTKTKKYTITLKAGKKAVKKVKVYLKIKGKTYKATTNTKGKATFKIKLKKKGTFNTKITFNGNKNYKATSKSIKIKIK